MAGKGQAYDRKLGKGQGNISVLDNYTSRTSLLIQDTCFPGFFLTLCHMPAVAEQNELLNVAAFRGTSTAGDVGVRIPQNFTRGFSEGPVSAMFGSDSDYYNIIFR